MRKWTLSFCLFLLFMLLLIRVQTPEHVNHHTQDDIQTRLQNHIHYKAVDQNEIDSSTESVHQQQDWDPAPIKVQIQSLAHIRYELFHKNNPLPYFEPLKTPVFPDRYTELPGIFTYRGDHFRTSPAFGFSDIEEEKLIKQWSYTTETSSWGGGAGWTGQPAIVQWPEEIRMIMNIADRFKEKESFVEVIYASLDGSVYFFDLETGEPSRPPLAIKNPIKGSVSVDPRGYPLLYVGEGIPEQKDIGYGLYSLIDFTQLYFVKGIDDRALRKWGAFDGSALINRETDTLYVGGENGLFYALDLNTSFNLEEKTITVAPQSFAYRYRIDGHRRQGIESSVAAYKNLAFFADNSGSIQALDLQTLTPIWALPPTDDTDATITVEVEDDIPYLYTGTEVDLQGHSGDALIRKINGLTGEVLWEVTYPCFTDPNVNGGMLATNVIGKHNIDHLVIFSIARYKKFNAGLVVALDKQFGQEVWRWESPNYAWSSPVDMYNQDGKAYVIQCDSAGTMTLLDAFTGDILDQISLGANIEASPAIFNTFIVVATRGQKIHGLRIK